MTKTNKIYNKFNGLCAYSGTPLEKDWQIDHAKPVVRNLITGKMQFKENDCIENTVPVQRLINHYKHSMDLEQFRKFISKLHERIKKLPRNPATEKSIKRKAYVLKVAEYFDIKTDKPFSGKFYFETLN